MEPSGGRLHARPGIVPSPAPRPGDGDADLHPGDELDLEGQARQPGTMLQRLRLVKDFSITLTLYSQRFNCRLEYMEEEGNFADRPPEEPHVVGQGPGRPSSQAAAGDALAGACTNHANAAPAISRQPAASTQSTWVRAPVPRSARWMRTARSGRRGSWRSVKPWARPGSASSPSRDYRFRLRKVSPTTSYPRRGRTPFSGLGMRSCSLTSASSIR